MKPIETLSSEKLKDARKILRALEHELRLDIINYLDEHPNAYVKQIYKSLDIEQSVASQHLNILRRSGLVKNERDGKNIHYSVNYELINEIKLQIDDFLED